MTQILDDPAVRTPAMMYLFHRVEERLDGSPTIIVVDEGWKALDDDVFVRRIKNWEKTIRKLGGIVGFATQSAQDRSEEHTSELQSLMRISYAVFCLKKKTHYAYYSYYNQSKQCFNQLSLSWTTTYHC